jgi:hypothetical protein
MNHRRYWVILLSLMGLLVVTDCKSTTSEGKV